MSISSTSSQSSIKSVEELLLEDEEHCKNQECVHLRQEVKSQREIIKLLSDTVAKLTESKTTDGNELKEIMNRIGNREKKFSDFSNTVRNQPSDKDKQKKAQVPYHHLRKHRTSHGIQYTCAKETLPTSPKSIQ